MDPQSRERWGRIEELLDAALDEAPDTPAGGRKALSAADPEIRAEAERLLAYAARVERFLVRPAAELAAALLAEAEPPLDAGRGGAPERIGPYRILEEAGRGGMATVYLAERDDPQLSQRVAVKVLPAGTAGRSLVRRFIRERQILASLNHPGVARLLDGGITEDGLPWFAMDYVDGVPITRYCDRRQLGIDARLQLFLSVCDAVQYAHRNLIVHRDLKPSNILVTEPTAGESLGRVKLLDFGIAKLLATEGGIDGATLTRTGMIPLTPEYASPEQLRGDPVSTASDVYQLGILLYELLAGRRPHSLAGLPAHEIHRVVSETDPVQPSSVITRDNMAADRVSSQHRLSAESVSEARASNPARLRRRLRGDLDNIALMALRAEPERRYASVERLADDVRRHLERQPVSARPDTVFYRAGRFVRRHRIGVASATMTFLLLVAFAGAMAVQAGRIARERDRAEQATAFLVGLFEAFEPVEARGVSVAVPEVLQLSLERARTELADQPLLRATVIDVIGQVYDLQNMQSEAEALYEEALEIRLASLGPTHLQVAESQDRLAGLWSEAGDFHAESLYRAALATYQRKLGNDDPRVVHARMALAILLRERGSYTAADSMLSEVVASGRRREAPNLDLATSLMFLGKLRTRSGEYDEAEKLIRESMDIRQALVGREHPSVANSLDALGEAMLERGEVDAADTLFHEGLAIRRALFEEGHTDIATGLTRLGRVRLWKGDHAGADSLLDQALAIFRRSFGEDSPDVAYVLEFLGATRLAQGNRESADSLLQQALAIWRTKAIEATHDRPATLLVRIGTLRMRQGELEPARSLLGEGLALRRSSLPEGHWRIAEAKGLLGACLSKAGRIDEAEPLLIEGYDGLRAVRGDYDAFTQRALRLLIEHYDRSGQPERATRYRARLQDSEAEPRTER